MFDFDIFNTKTWKYAIGAVKSYTNYSYQLNPKKYTRGEDGTIRLIYKKSPKGKAAIKAAKRLTHEKGFYRKQREANA